MRLPTPLSGQPSSPTTSREREHAPLLVSMEILHAHPHWPGIGHVLSTDPIAMARGCRPLIGQLGLSNSLRVGGFYYPLRCKPSQNADICSRRRSYLQGSQARRRETKSQILLPQGKGLEYLYGKE